MLVASHTRGVARSDSDVDLVMLTGASVSFASSFGPTTFLGERRNDERGVCLAKVLINVEGGSEKLGEVVFFPASRKSACRQK